MGLSRPTHSGAIVLLTPAPIIFYELTHTASKVVFSSPLWVHLPPSKGYQNILVTKVITFLQIINKTLQLATHTVVRAFFFGRWPLGLVHSRQLADLSMKSSNHHMTHHIGRRQCVLAFRFCKENQNDVDKSDVICFPVRPHIASDNTKSFVSALIFLFPAWFQFGPMVVFFIPCVESVLSCFCADRRSVPRMLSTESRTEDNPYDYRHLLRKTSQRRKLIKQYWTRSWTDLLHWLHSDSTKTFQAVYEYMKKSCIVHASPSGLI